MKSIILAVSGGIDSMALLWLHRNHPNAVVAHFNHGTRPSSDDDEDFVRHMATHYGLPFESKKLTLGANVSEVEARLERYRFLAQVAEKYNGEIYTAHHADDVVESIAINLLRGTGWRGLAVMGNSNISRPLLEMSKKDIYQLADREELTFRQDPTNAEDAYLRNRIREQIRFLSSQVKNQLVYLRRRQVELATEIDHIIDGLLPDNHVYQREWFHMLDDDISLEILRAALKRSDIPATRPQILNFLNAIRTYSSEKSFNLPGGHLVKLHKDYFVL